MSEETDDGRLQTLGGEVVTVLHSISRAVTLYDANNAAVVRLIDALLKSVEAVFALGHAELKIQILLDEVFINGRLLKVDPVMYDRASTLAERLAPYDIGELVFTRGLDRKAVESFVGDLAMTLRGSRSTVRSDGYGGLTLGKSQGSSIASFRFEPDRLAVWLFTSLLDLSERLYTEHAAGNAPSLLPLKRTLQLIIDNMRTHGSIYQLLATVQNPARPPTYAASRAITAVNLVGFGIYLGLPNAELMNLALAGVLGGLSPSNEPDEAVRVLLRFPGMGDNAMPLTLLLHDARSARRGEPCGQPGAIVALVEEFVRGVHATERRGAVSPARVLQALQAGRIGWVPNDIAAAFAAWKGPYPLGALVELKPRGIAVVVGQSEHAMGKQRPVVALVNTDGSLGARLDLVNRRDLEIGGAPDPAKSGVKLQIHTKAG